MPARRYELLYTTAFKVHLQAIERKHHALIRTEIEEQLRFEPEVRTKNRKPLTEARIFAEGTWEIRFGPGSEFRVFYEIDQQQFAVRVLAVGIKKGNRLYIGGEEIEL
ncbi:MAG: type II toxin-antitoxin system RelE/ParE family toxin [Candidatus Latescibacteria bacterium]|nr:type II toxin-antitoxin system RelE/ParE family toxin [Candidatus Latescibacterota bacterium]